MTELTPEETRSKEKERDEWDKLSQGYAQLAKVDKGTMTKAEEKMSVMCSNGRHSLCKGCDCVCHAYI